MHFMRRRQFLLTAPLAAQQLPLKDFEPTSMLATSVTKVERARYPAIDFHAHLCWSAKSQNGVGLVPERTYLAPPAELLAVMERRNIRTLCNLTGGYGAGVRDAISKYDKVQPGRFMTFMEPMWAAIAASDYAKRQADEVVAAAKAGARGLKVLKTLGLYLREDVTAGKLIAVDDRRFDPMWEACAAMQIPVAIHVSDPLAFFTPTDRKNERYEELNNHPDWSFYGPGFPTNDQLLAARDRVIARHPKTQFVALHAGNFAENLSHVAERLSRYPNLHIDIAARVGELGRQPRASKRFFDKYQDRIVFGTDAVPHGDQFPQQLFGDLLYQIYFRFLETEDEYFDYAPAKVPPQGRWRIYGLGLSDAVLKKIYAENARRLLRA